MKEIEIAGRKVGVGQPCLTIAEAGINHNGDLNLAKRMVHAAKEVGAGAIKFQTFTAKNLMTASAGFYYQNTSNFMRIWLRIKKFN